MSSAGTRTIENVGGHADLFCMTDIVTLPPVDTEAELDVLADRYRSANRAGVRVLNALGGGAEDVLARLPKPVRAGLDAASEQALWLAMRAAQRSRHAVTDQAPWVNTACATAMGAAGGLGGMPTALIELPATTTMLLRSIQGAAKSQGFDPAAENVQFDCVRVFAAAGPLAVDDGADLGFLSVRLSLTGNALGNLISAVAPRFSTAIGQKLAARAVPILGAFAGASSNFIYCQYYQSMAEVQFGLRRLAVEADQPREELVARLEKRLQIRPT